MTDAHLKTGWIFNRSFHYAVQAIVAITAEGEAGWVSRREISRRIGGPTDYLAKICHDLTCKGLLCSHKGPRGGFKLAEGTEKLTIYEIVEIILGSERENECPFCIPGCGPDNPCSVHESWMEVVRHIEAFMIENTISSLANL